MKLGMRRVERDGVMVLVPEGDVDIATVGGLRDHVARVVADRSPDRLVLDLSGLRFMDSAGVHAVLDAERLLDAYGGRLAVVTGPAHIHQVFELTGAVVRAPLAPSLDAAVRALDAVSLA